MLTGYFLISTAGLSYLIESLRLFFFFLGNRIVIWGIIKNLLTSIFWTPSWPDSSSPPSLIDSPGVLSWISTYGFDNVKMTVIL